MPEIAVVDASALIGLEKINLLDILCRLYEEIILPEAVINEFGTPTIDCYSAKKVESPLVRLLVSDLNLGKGESEVRFPATHEPSAITNALCSLRHALCLPC